MAHVIELIDTHFNFDIALIFDNQVLWLSRFH